MLSTRSHRLKAQVSPRHLDLNLNLNLDLDLNIDLNFDLDLNIDLNLNIDLTCEIPETKHSPWYVWLSTRTTP